MSTAPVQNVSNSHLGEPTGAPTFPSDPRVEDHLADGEHDVLPVLWSLSGQRAQALADVPHRVLVPGHLAVAIAACPRGMEDYGDLQLLTHDVFRMAADPPFDQALDDVWEEIATGLRIDVDDPVGGDRVLIVHRPGSIGAAALTLPNFHETVSDYLDAERVVVGVPGHSHLVVTAHGSNRVEEIETFVREAGRPDHGLGPSLWLLQSAGLSLLRAWV